MIHRADTKTPIYLDYNATTPLKPQIVEAMTSALYEPGNASSVHSFGRKARSHIEKARQQLADLVKSSTHQIVFTSGATEANNTVLQTFINKNIAISAIEHPSVLNISAKSQHIPVTQDGVVDLSAFDAIMKRPDRPDLVSVMLVNNETGVIQPVKEITRIAHQYGALVHTDAVQAAGRIPINFHDLGIDILCLSAHKFGGPIGAGCLVYRKGLDPFKLLYGGGQERKSRPGTENVPAIIGMGMAAQYALEDFSAYQELAKLRDYLESRMKDTGVPIKVYGQNAPRVANTTCVGVFGIPAETQLMTLDLEGFAISTGSACSSGSIKPSHVLTAMNVREEDAASTLRISTGWNTKQEDIEMFLKTWSKMAKRFTQ